MISGRLRAGWPAGSRGFIATRSRAVSRILKNENAWRASVATESNPMCGIAGYVSDTVWAPEVLAAMTRSIAHRGPDADGHYRSGRGHLGHRRLSIIDIAGSPQPMLDPAGRVAVVFNGEIYNFRELRTELAARGWTFRTAGDTETLLAGWHAWGEQVVERLRGMFAFALWDDTHADILCGARPSGRQAVPLRVGRASLVFGSELKAVLDASGGRPRRRSRRAAALSRVPVHSRAAFGLRRRAQAAAGAHAEAASEGR